jgi:hypothetical protein
MKLKDLDKARDLNAKLKKAQSFLQALNSNQATILKLDLEFSGFTLNPNQQEKMMPFIKDLISDILTELETLGVKI